MLVTQYPKFETPFAAVAWERVLELEAFDPRLTVTAYTCIIVT